ncbi:MAG TPA: xanthine dehydrogenase family protein subunit M [Candidatus Limnocylindria bacterium]|nr:xanthine dehydrogenase family protein subunit M [Candidatus Limnocylindria bacterium]
MFAYARPERLDEVFALWDAEPTARLLSGGTDLLVAIRTGRARPPLVIDLKRVQELAPGIAERDGALRIGASTVLSDLVADPRVRAAFPALVDAALVVGSIQIRNRATLVGNVCNASPAADTATPLLAYGASVEISGRSGTRRVALDAFFVGPGRTALEPSEVVSAIELPLPTGPIGAAFRRMTRRRGVDLATVNLCCVVASDGVTRIGFGAVAPRPLLVVDDSGVLADPDADPDAQETVLRRLAAETSPISNVRASREYRAAMLLVLTRRALAAARKRLDEARHGGR